VGKNGKEGNGRGKLGGKKDIGNGEGEEKEGGERKRNKGKKKWPAMWKMSPALRPGVFA
jgi:hypothetical protein